MSEVYAFLKLQLLFTAFLSALLWALYGRSVRRDFFRWWAWAWTCFGGFLLLAILSIRLAVWPAPVKLGLIFLTTELAFVHVPLLMLGAWSLRSGEVETRWVRRCVIAALAAGGLTFAFSLTRSGSVETSFFLRSVPRTVALAAAMLFCATMFARYWWRRRSSAAAFSAVCCLLYGANQVFYSLSLSERLLLGTSSAHRLFDLRFIQYHEFVLLDVCYTAGLCLAILLLRFEEQRRLEQALIVSDRRATSIAARNVELQEHVAERRRLGQRLIHAQEEERSRVARELHDNINQRLALLGIAIQQARRALPEPSDGPRTQLDKLWHMTDEISHEVQALSHELHSAHLRHLGLAAAVAHAAKEFEQNHEIPVECWAVGVPEDLSADVALALFRVVQEALHNAGKYSHATKLHVGIEGLPHALHLEVSDDGVGFDPQGITGDGLGLTSMEERVRFIGAEFHLVSAPGTGTRIEVMVPLAVPRKQAAREESPAVEAHAGA
jgi:signal transduction histidine kinase